MTDTPTTPWPTLPDGRMLVLRTCDAQMRSEHSPSFVWPPSGPVEAPDWDPDPDRDCGGGLHGLLWGCGNASMLSSSSTVRWLVVAVDPADIANPDAPGKVRFRSGEVVLVTTDRAEAVAHLEANGAALLPTVYGTPTSGHGGTSISGDRGTSTSGDCGTSISGDRGTSTSGHHGTSISGHGGTSTSGHGGIVVVGWWDGKAARLRLTVGYVGEDGIEANTTYRCSASGVLEAVRP